MGRAVHAPEEPSPGDIVAAARRWIGTPYRHRASCLGGGCDCIGLVRGVWRALYGDEPEAVPYYDPGMWQSGGEETLLAAAGRHLAPLSRREAQDGDVLVMRMVGSPLARHAGILASVDPSHPTVIHAYSGHGVVESPLTPQWARRVAGVFRFPRTRRL